MDGEIHVVIDVVTRRIVIVLFAVGIFPMQLGTRLTNLGIAAGDLRKIEHVGVRLAPARAARHDEAAGILVENHLHVVAERARGVKLRNALLVGLAPVELLANLIDRRAAAIREPRRKLRRAFLAKVAVFKLFVAQKADLAAADVAVLLLEHLSEKSHRNPPVTRVGRFNVVLSDFMMPRIARRKKCPAAQGRRRGMDVCL